MPLQFTAVRSACSVHYEMTFSSAEAGVSSNRWTRLFPDKSLFSFLRQTATWHCPDSAARLPLTAGRAAIDRYLLSAAPTAANPQRQRRVAAE